MKIGLVRHFKVQHNFGKYMTSEDFRKYVDYYDRAEVIPKEVDMRNMVWDKCYSSDLPRAVRTAQAIYNGEILKTELLREIRLSPAFNTEFRIPLTTWNVLGRLAWYMSHNSQAEKRHETEKRAKDFLLNILSLGESNILIVSHGGMMFHIQKELSRNGFRGERFTKAENGRLYIFER